TMERAVLVYTTWPSIVEAEAAGRKIVERRLAACGNILPRVEPISRLGTSDESTARRRFPVFAGGGKHQIVMFAVTSKPDLRPIKRQVREVPTPESRFPKSARARRAGRVSGITIQ